MFRYTLNELRVTLEIRPTSPLLIKEGRHFERKPEEKGKEWEDRVFFHQGVKRRPLKPRKKKKGERGYGDYANAEDCFDMAFVYTEYMQGQYRFYLPGSSLRGVLRTTAEHIVGRWQPDLARAGDPFANATESWLETQGNVRPKPDSAAIYSMTGPLDRCFGHTAMRGHWSVADAWMRDNEKAKVIVRDGVGINRKTGAAQNNVKFQFEAITGGVFTTTLTLVNYELWQLGLLAHVLAELDSGHARLGYGTRRGLGHVQVRVPTMTWRWYQQEYSMQQPEGVVTIPSLATLAEKAKWPSDADYGLRDGELELTLPLKRKDNGGLVPDWVWAGPATGDGRPGTGDRRPGTGDRGRDYWDGEPWASLGPLLTPALEKWPTVPEPVEDTKEMTI